MGTWGDQMAIEFNIEIHFEAPPDKVFEALTNVDSLIDWLPNIKGVNILSQGPYGEGTVFEETRRVFFRDATERFRVSIFEPPEILELTVDGSEGSSGSGNYTFFYHLEVDSATGGTSMSMHGEITGLNRIMEIIGQLTVRLMARSIRKDYAALAKYLATQSSE